MATKRKKPAKKATRKPTKAVRRPRKAVKAKKATKKAPRKAVKAKKATKKAPRKTKKASTGTKRKSGLAQMMCTVSADLESVVGAKSLTRPQIVKKLWDYIKAHKCQDMKNRRMINPDAKLANVFGTKQPVNMLKMAGLISKHIH